MDADGTQAGYDLELTRTIAERVPVPVIASGGAGNCQHIHAGPDQRQSRSRPAGVFTSLWTAHGQKVKDYLQDHQVPVRNT
jgi:cyclase